MFLREYKFILIIFLQTYVSISEIDLMVDKGLHQLEDGTFSCGFCGKLSSTKQHMRNHVEIHLNLRFSCDICNKQYNTRNSVGVHKSSVHKNGKGRKNYFAFPI